MKIVSVHTSLQQYDILAGWHLYTSDTARRALSRIVSGRRCLIVTDSNVAPLYADAVSSMLTAADSEDSVSVFPAGEPSKTLATTEALYHAALSHGLGRDSVIVALGGGVAGDLAGFAAATFMRGIPFVQIPTSLLAMVDSSVGGKVGVDLPEGKNLVGAFHQPGLVMADIAALQTLPERELHCGLAEVIKYGLIMDRDFFAVLEREMRHLLALDRDICESVVCRCCQLKADVVCEDEKEQTGRRAILNYGHTFGHALEVLCGYTELNHGEGVAIGMGMAAELAVQLGLASPELVQRQDALLRAAGLPTHLSKALDAATVVETMKRDKKVKRGKLRFIVVPELGQTEFVEAPDEGVVLDAVRRRCG